MRRYEIDRLKSNSSRLGRCRSAAAIPGADVAVGLGLRIGPIDGVTSTPVGGLGLAPGATIRLAGRKGAVACPLRVLAPGASRLGVVSIHRRRIPKPAHRVGVALGGGAGRERAAPCAGGMGRCSPSCSQDRRNHKRFQM
jgi:hypothetical protein